MPYRLLLTGALLIIAATVATAQSSLPVLTSTDSVLTITTNGEVSTNNWGLAPRLRPDIYASSTIGARVTFLSDQDSISTIVDPNTPFDFVVVYGKDSAFTQVRYEISKLDILKQHAAYAPDDQMTIPAFTYASQDRPDLRKW